MATVAHPSLVSEDLVLKDQHLTWSERRLVNFLLKYCEIDFVKKKAQTWGQTFNKLHDSKHPSVVYKSLV